MAAKTVPGLHPDAGFPRLKSAIIERTGHFYYQNKDDLLWERVRKRIQAAGMRDCSEYLSLLSDPDSGPVEWTRLEADITIGETFFFRYAEQFAALRRTILPEIIERKRAERRLRIWSAGCATGAEPYSLAILLKQLLGEDLENWRTSIIGTDINETFLATARQATFGKWALRSLSPEDKASYFVPTGREQWQLRPEFRSLARFERHNLLSLLDGTSPLQFTEFDLILCRNVLIYFHPDTVTRVVGALHNCLRDDGWMLVGHAEPNPSFSAMMQALSLPGTVAYRRRPAEGQTLAPPFDGTNEPMPPMPLIPRPKIPSPPLSPSKPAQPNGRRPAPQTEKAQVQPPALVTPDPAALLADVRQKADAGDVATAYDLCREALRHHPLDAALHFYLGLVSQTMKRPTEAEEAFRRCIYLDKSFAMAHYHLGLLLLADGRPGPGRRALANAARIVAAMPDGNLLEEADGLTAKHLRNLVRMHLEAAARLEQRG